MDIPLTITTEYISKGVKEAAAEAKKYAGELEKGMAAARKAVGVTPEIMSVGDYKKLIAGGDAQKARAEAAKAAFAEIAQQARLLQAQEREAAREAIAGEKAKGQAAKERLREIAQNSRLLQAQEREAAKEAAAAARKAADELKKGDFWRQLSALRRKLMDLTVIVGAAVGSFVLLAKQAFNFGLLGAQVAQTTESFNSLIGRVGVVPSLLQDLRAASRGTISDFELMKSTMTVVAGTAGELEKSLLAATPQMLEIARAAVKLNPALGDVAFMYESITQASRDRKDVSLTTWVLLFD